MSSNSFKLLNTCTELQWRHKTWAGLCHISDHAVQQTGMPPTDCNEQIIMCKNSTLLPICSPISPSLSAASSSDVSEQDMFCQAARRLTTSDALYSISRHSSFAHATHLLLHRRQRGGKRGPAMAASPGLAAWLEKPSETLEKLNVSANLCFGIDAHVSRE
jgi:hypothetical protein